MTNHLIPDAAVKAAVAAYRAKVEWIDRHSRDDYGREDELGMIAAIEAASPFLEPSEDAIREAMADGWDEAEQAQYVISLNPTGTAWEAIKTNPYRSQS